MSDISNISALYTKYKSFKEGMSKEESWELWLSISGYKELGIYQVNPHTKKMSFRVYDDTASVAIFENLIAFDFGGSNDKGVDPISRIMEVTGFNFQEALVLFMSWLGEDIEIKPPELRYKKNKKSQPDPYKPNYLRRVIKDRKIYSESYENLAKGLFRGVTDKERKYAESVLYIGYIPATEEYVDRIFIPEMNEAGVAYGSYRYNRGAEPKGLLRAASKRVLFGSHMLPKMKKHIIYSEGHSDTVVNIAKRYGCVTTGSSTKKLEDNISLLSGKTVLDFPDLDIAGMKGAMSRHEEILKFNSTVQDSEKITHIIFWWADWFTSEKIYEKISLNKIEKNDEFIDIVDKIVIQNNLAGFKKSDLRIIQEKICKKKSWNFENHDIDNWKVIYKKQAKKMGFDFIDFYESENSKEKQQLIDFLDKHVKF